MLCWDFFFVDFYPNLVLIWKLVVLLSYFYISSKLASLRIIFIPIFSKQKTSGHFAQEKRSLAMQDLVFIVWSLHSCAKAEISQTTMALVERVFMETNLQMKTSSWNMVAQVIIFLFLRKPDHNIHVLMYKHLNEN